MKYAFAGSRKALKWTNGEITWEKLRERFQHPVRTMETMAEYRAMTTAQKTEVKDVGGFVGGHLKNGLRKKDAVLCRSMATVDLDFCPADVWETKLSVLPFKLMCHSTHKHTPENPRLRVVLCFKREVTALEYEAIVRMLASEIGIDMFDPVSFMVHQLMFLPSYSADGEYFFREKDGIELDPDEYLAKYTNWQDSSTWPRTSNESKVVNHGTGKLADPRTKKGIVGAFCRAYPMSQAIEEFLSEEYEPTESPNRYHYKPADSAGGVIVYDDLFSISFHVSDPAFGRVFNAFDLIRVHRFRNLDEDYPEDTPFNQLPSYKAMKELAEKCYRVKAMLLEEKRAEAQSDFDVPAEKTSQKAEKDWKDRLVWDETELEPSLFNARLILVNDPKLKGIMFNELADNLEITGKVPWKHSAKFWRDADDAQLICYLADAYGVTFTDRILGIAVTKVTDDRSYHPIKQYFNGLPVWDRNQRAETMVIDYLGADNTPYVRAVTRKFLCAAYIRVYYPGIKFDYMPVFNGPQGIGKSTLIAKLGMKWFSDCLTLFDMNDKSAAEKLQGYWIHEISELAGMKKADINKVKSFISRCDDQYRAAFGKRVTPHPRQSVFIGTTNSENGYLRDVTGNRRFWNIRVTGNSKYKPWDLTQEVIDQIWAEVKVMVEAGETLYLPKELEMYAEEEQRRAMEQDDREGLLVEYLDMLLPDNWSSMDLHERRAYILDLDDPTRPKGTIQRAEVSNLEIWCECFGKRPEDIQSKDSYAISAMMVRLKGWEKSTGSKRIPFYGKQRFYRRK